MSLRRNTANLFDARVMAIRANGAGGSVFSETEHRRCGRHSHRVASNEWTRAPFTGASEPSCARRRDRYAGSARCLRTRARYLRYRPHARSGKGPRAVRFYGAQPQPPIASFAMRSPRGRAPAPAAPLAATRAQCVQSHCQELSRPPQKAPLPSCA